MTVVITQPVVPGADVSVAWDGYELNPGFLSPVLSNSVTAVTGWYDTPVNEGHDATLVLADGGVYGPKTLDPRVITITGACAGPFPELFGIRNQIAQRAVARAESTLVISDTAAAMQATVRASTDQLSFAFIDGTGNTAATWQVVLTANDQRLYGLNLMSVTLGTDEEGTVGRTYPRTYDWDYGGTAGMPNRAVLRNPGDTNAPVTALYTGPLSQTLLLDGTGQPTGIIVAALGDGQQLTVACDTLVARDPSDGAVRQQLIGAGSRALPLPPGQETWQLQGTGDGSVRLTWRAAWL